MSHGTPRAGLVFRCVAGLVSAIIRVLGWRTEVEGLEHVPRHGGALVTFNHHSYADFAVTALPIYHELGRPVRFLAKAELFTKPVLGWIVRAAKQVPVPRDSRTGRAEALAAAVEALRSGEVIAVAPEQTISRSFELLPFTTGTVRMARDAGVPIVPQVNWGTHRWATKGRPVDWGARGIPVLVRYGEPLHVGADDDLDEATEELRVRMERMLHEVQASYPHIPAPGEDWWLPRRLGGSAPSHEEVLAEHRERESRWRGPEPPPTP